MFHSREKHLQGPPNIQAISEGKYLTGGVLYERGRDALLKFEKISLNEINLGVIQAFLTLTDARNIRIELLFVHFFVCSPKRDYYCAFQ